MHQWLQLKAGGVSWSFTLEIYFVPQLFRQIIPTSFLKYSHVIINCSVSFQQTNNSKSTTSRSHLRKQTQPRRHKREYHALKEIRKYQKSCHLLIRKASFARVVREILIEKHRRGSEFRWQQAAIECLHEASEAYLVSFLSDAYLCSTHAKRVTLMPRDLHLIKRIRGNSA